WHMSVDELLNVMGAFRRQGTILSPAQAQTMLDNGFGVDVANATPLGTRYNKNGLWQDGAGHTEQNLAYFRPRGIRRPPRRTCKKYAEGTASSRFVSGQPFPEMHLVLCRGSWNLWEGLSFEPQFEPRWCSLKRREQWRKCSAKCPV